MPKPRKAPGEPQTPCSSPQHHWDFGEAAHGLVPATCRNCGATRTYKAGWGRAVLPPGKWLFDAAARGDQGIDR